MLTPKTFSQYIKDLFDEESDKKKSPNGLILSVFYTNSSEIVRVIEPQNDYMLVESINGSVFAIPYSSAIAKVTNVTHSQTHEWKGK
jgi:hypothetical protein